MRVGSCFCSVLWSSLSYLLLAPNIVDVVDVVDVLASEVVVVVGCCEESVGCVRVRQMAPAVILLAVVSAVNLGGAAGHGELAPHLISQV